MSLNTAPLTMLDGRQTSFAEFAGKTVLVVNVASRCGLSPQYEALEQLQNWHRPGQLPLASSVRIQAQGLRANGDAVTMAAVWGAVADGDHVRLLPAVVYDRQISPEMANTLFDGLKP